MEIIIRRAVMNFRRPACTGATLQVNPDNVRILMAHKKKKKKLHCKNEPKPIVKKPQLRCPAGSLTFPKPDPHFPLRIKAGSYRLQEYHWHSPSQHTVDGGYFPWEIPSIHRVLAWTVPVVLLQPIRASLDPQRKMGIGLRKGETTRRAPELWLFYYWLRLIFTMEFLFLLLVS